MNYIQARKIADRIVELLQPHCDKIDIAGSIRRQKAEVKDIEVCCLPKQEFVQTDLLGGGSLVRTRGFADAINLFAHKIIKGQDDGKMMQIQLKGNTPLMLDLFIPLPDDYYRVFAIRTGSALYSEKVIAAGWCKKGWRGTYNAGLRLMQYTMQTKSGWKCLNINSPLPPVWQSEEEFFNWIDVPWTAPYLRNI